MIKPNRAIKIKRNSKPVNPGIKRNESKAQKSSTPKIEKRPVGRPKGSGKKRIGLDESHQLFADLILENMHKTKAKKETHYNCYRKAFKRPDIKEKSAQVYASKVLARPDVQQYIQDRKKAAANRVEITVSKVLTGLLRIAEFDPRKVFDEKGRPIPIHKLDDDTALGLSSIDFQITSKRLPSGRRKLIYTPKSIKTEARKPAWELLGTHLQMWHGEDGSSTPQDFVNEIREFADEVGAAVPGGKI